MVLEIQILNWDRDKNVAEVFITNMIPPLTIVISYPN
jgi:hypothetical protein